MIHTEKIKDISICPTFKCNMNCLFCYLRHRTDNILDLDDLDRILSQYEIRNMDVYGGEITCLDDSYALKMVSVLQAKNDKIRFVSNGLNVSKIWEKIFIENSISFSLDKSRRCLDIVRKYIYEFDRKGKKYSIITVDIDDIDEQFLNSLLNLESFSIKPYSPANKNIKYNTYMLDIYKRLYYYNKKLFYKLEYTQDQRDAVQHLFLMPDSNLYDIQYNDGIEYFELSEKCSQRPPVECMVCKYYGRCFNEHYNGYCKNKNEKDCLGRYKVMEFLDEVHNIR